MHQFADYFCNKQQRADQHLAPAGTSASMCKGVRILLTPLSVCNTTQALRNPVCGSCYLHFQWSRSPYQHCRLLEYWVSASGTEGEPVSSAFQMQLCMDQEPGPCVLSKSVIRCLIWDPVAVPYFFLEMDGILLLDGLLVWLSVTQLPEAAYNIMRTPSLAGCMTALSSPVTLSSPGQA